MLYNKIKKQSQYVDMVPTVETWAKLFEQFCKTFKVLVIIHRPTVVRNDKYLLLSRHYEEVLHDFAGVFSGLAYPINILTATEFGDVNAVDRYMDNVLFNYQF